MRLRLCLLPLLVFLSVAAFAAVEPVQVLGHRVGLEAPAWVRDRVVYEVNVRQFSEAGTFAAVEADLPRIRELGIGVLWFMPIHPIGAVNRKGPLGSYYSVADYRGVNPEFGTHEDFARLVNAAHAAGFKVILDWVANHTAWDHPWTKEQPEFYAKGEDGNFVPPYGFDWTDVIQLDYTNRDLWNAMIEDMAFWVQTADVDGFRCDYAKGVPTAFWDEASTHLRAIKPDLFMLAESEMPQHHLAAFHASYTFSMMHVFNDVAAGKVPVSKIYDELTRNRVRFPTGTAFFRYTTNHDENSWQGTVFERLGDGLEAFAVLSFVLDGVPLIYNGQEAGLDKRLEFFERDPIAWRPHPLARFYKTLCSLKENHPALRTGAQMRRIATTAHESIYAVMRTTDAGKVVAICNLTDKEADFAAVEPALKGSWTDVFTGEKVEIGIPFESKLPAWGYRVLKSAE
ncbi:MAG TPA: alpha-amylase family glycosyl hydrolase [Opitutaceae bacterium]